jgi:hypothetical protein
LGDNDQHFIKTVPRRGYIFEAEVIENGSGTRGTIHTGLGGGSRLLAGENEAAVESTDHSAGRPAFCLEALDSKALALDWYDTTGDDRRFGGFSFLAQERPAVTALSH